MKGDRVIVSQHVRAAALATLLGLLLAGAAQPAGARPIPPRPAVDLGSVARLVPDGSSIDVDLLASCPDRWTPVEARVTVAQGQASGTASFPLSCTGGNQLFTVTVRSSVPFQLGEAQATASVIIQRGRTERAQDTEVVRVVPNVVVDLADTAVLEGGGQAVSIEVTTACATGAAGEQSYVTITQSPVSGTGFFTPTCDGKSHTFGVTVQSSQGLFLAGTAQGSAFVTVGEGGDVFFGEDNHAVELLVS